MSDLRILILLLAGLLLSDVGNEFFSAQYIDRQLFSWASQLDPRQAKVDDIAIITLSDAQLNQLISPSTQITATNKLLQFLQRRRDGQVALLLDDLPHISEAENQLLSISHQLPLFSVDHKKMQIYHQRHKQIQHWLKQDDVIVGLSNPYQSIAGGIYTELVFSGQISSAINKLPAWFPLSLLMDPVAHSENPWASSMFYSLLLSHNKTFSTDIALALYLQSLAINPGHKTLRWWDHQTLRWEGGDLPLASDGRIIPLYNSTFGKTSNIRHFNLKQALADFPQHKTLIIAADDNVQLQQVADSFLSLRSGHYYYQPIWAKALGKALIILLLLLSLFIMPRLPLSSGLLLTALLIMTAIALQLVWQITQQQFLALGAAMQFLLFACLLMSLRKLHSKPYKVLLQAFQKNTLQLASLQLQQGLLDETIISLKQCPASKPMLLLFYDAAVALERKRQYTQAAQAYACIAALAPGFKDAKVRAVKLAAIDKPQGNDALLAQQFSQTQTLAMPMLEQGLQKPVLGRYQVERELGRGANGIVYLGRDPKIARQVAIKTLSYKQLEPAQKKLVLARFYREAEAAGRLSHPAIVTVYDIGEEHDMAFIAMDFVKGQPLSRFSHAENLLPPATVFQLISEVADALDYAHRQKIVHRDIKPSNLMYNPETGIIKVTDFGIARLTDDSCTKTGDIFGSPVYMSPEQLSGKKVSGQADIYSLGVTFYQLLTGQPPFTGDSLPELTYQILNRKPKSPRQIRQELPASATRIINKAMHKDPTKRFVDAGEMGQAIRKAMLKDFAKEAVA
ncbi:MAG: serine/threonine protein kinase [Pseudomonadales bacterium]|nr:serine/threonine protein kinase [Pseudomonadales bacterium]